MKKSLTLTIAALALTIPAFAAPAQTSPAPAQTPAKTADVFPTKCPVTGEAVASAKEAVGSSTYKGKTYYFCCAACKPEFDKDPAKFVKSASAK